MKISKLQRKTVERALIWAEQNLHPDKPRAWSCRHIEKQFGKRKIGQWLRQQLLITTKPNWSIEHHECKEYCLNLVGMDIVKQSIGLTTAQAQNKVIDDLVEKFKDQLDSGEFTYVNKSNRNHHPLQSVRKEIRSQVLTSHGYHYDYDMVCAAPNLLYQRALATGMKPLTVIPQYIELRTDIRQHISSNYGIELSAVKQVITGLFQGGYISKWSNSECYKTLKGNYNHIERLRSDPLIQALVIEIKQMWQHIISDMRLNGEFNEPRVLGKHKAEIYRSIEEEVMREVKRYLRKHKIKFFEIHDGFQTTEIIDQEDLAVFVRSNTRYQISLERSYLLSEKTTTLS